MLRTTLPRPRLRTAIRQEDKNPNKLGADTCGYCRVYPQFVRLSLQCPSYSLVMVYRPDFKIAPAGRPIMLESIKMMSTTMNKTDQLEALRANLRTLIRNSGKTLQDIIDQTGIPRATLYQRLNQEGSSIYIHEVHKIWTACGKPGNMSDLLK